MCLIKNHKFPRIAWKPIKVYKIVFEKKDGTFITPSMEVECSTGDTLTNRHFFLKGILNDILEGEVVHAYKQQEYAEKSMRINVSSIATFQIVEATIPRFSFYWEGLYGEIGATKMVIGKKVPRLFIKTST